MHFSLSKRGFIRIVSYTVALVLALGLGVWHRHMAALDYKNQLEYTYARSLGELSSYLTNISTDLDKGQYVGTPGQLAQLSARIWKGSGSAKSALSSLPVGDLHMDNTYKFLSQVGDYAMMLSKKVAAGGTLTKEETENAEKLAEYASKLRDYIDNVHNQVRDGQINITAMRTTTANDGEDTEGTKSTAGIASGFKDMEETMTGYPTLIYDGPFSDHLLTQRPKLTEGLEEITPEQAQQKAARATRINAESLTRTDDENSLMPSYVFEGRDTTVGVTKAGGLITYLTNSREITDQRLGRNAVFEKAEQYLASLGIQNMRATYYETSNGICTINFAAIQDDVILYTDLIKVGVALDDGSIVSFDARGYITNHHARTLATPVLSAEEAAKSLNPSLTILSSRLALIPTSGKNEVLTYEFQTKTDKDLRLLVYVNVENGAEEQILILLESPEGTMTK